jgi:hypothetical protein
VHALGVNARRAKPILAECLIELIGTVLSRAARAAYRARL